MKYLLTIFIIFLLATPGWAWQLTSDPSEQNATEWKVELENGEVYEGETVEGQLAWDITDLSPGRYIGEAFFGVAEWELDAEGEIQKTGYTWSEGTPFTLIRTASPKNPGKIKIEK